MNEEIKQEATTPEVVETTAAPEAVTASTDAPASPDSAPKRGAHRDSKGGNAAESNCYNGRHCQYRCCYENNSHRNPQNEIRDTHHFSFGLVNFAVSNSDEKISNSEC